MMLYGYKSTVGIALGTLKLSANICRHNKCRRSLTEPTTQVSTKVCNPKRGLAGETKKNPQNILPLSPSRLRHEKEKAPRPIHARPASAPAAAASHGRQASLPPTPSLVAAASHTEPRRHSLPCQHPPPPSCTAPLPTGTLTTDAPSPAVPRRRKMWPILAPHRLQLQICAHSMRYSRRSNTVRSTVEAAFHWQRASQSHSCCDSPPCSRRPPPAPIYAPWRWFSARSSPRTRQARPATTRRIRLRRLLSDLIIHL